MGRWNEMAWKATIRYEDRGAMGHDVVAEQTITGETVDCQLWQPNQDIMWIGSGKTTILVPMRRLISIVKEQVD